MGAEKFRKGLDEQALEGGLGGAGGRSATARKVQSMTPQERATLENVGKQFEVSSAMQERAMEKIRKAKETKDPSEFANIGEQFRKKKGGLTASKRADGIAKRGKTRGKVL